MSSAPLLLVPWEPRWRSLAEGLGPALRRSASALPAECDRGLPRISFATSLSLHAALVLALLGLSARVRVPHVITQDPARDQHITYFAGRELPQMEDASGAESGRTGLAGGSALFHPRQTITVSRGPELVRRVVEAPALPLPRSDVNVANLVALPALPRLAPQPTERVLARRPASAEVAPPRVTASAVPDVPVARPAAPVIAPSISAPVRTAAELRSPAAELAVVRPPVTAPARDAATLPKLPVPAADPIAPPPALPVREVASLTGAGAVAPSAIPPPVSPSATGALPHLGNALPGAPQVSPAVGARGGVGGVASASNGKGLVISDTPGAAVGVPGASSGTLALSPHGRNTPGAGGSGGGPGIGRGTGPGSGTSGNGPGAGRAGEGFGADTHARGGTAPGAGPGGTGAGGATTEMAGVTIRGGTITLGSFGPALPSVGAGSGGVLGPRKAPAITVVGTSRSGGALNRYGVLKGAKVYTVYLDTRLGAAVLQFSERPGAGNAFQADLTPPEALNSDLPGNVAGTHLLVRCVIDRSGAVRDLGVLEEQTAETTATLLAALRAWRFRPVLRGDEAIEVDAIIGFGVTTH